MRFSEFIKINEVDWQGAFKDVKTICLDQEEIVQYLNKVRAKKNQEYSDREKISKNMPYIHPSSEFFKDTKQGIDVYEFKRRITQPPATLINTNEKILKSGGLYEYVYKTGIPAFRGIVFDQEKDKFLVINTCPGAGECVVICYALHGNYIRYPAAYDSMTKRLNLLLNNPEEFQRRLFNEIKEKCVEHNAYKGNLNSVVIRWNDSGDFFSNKYIQIANDVIKNLQDFGYNVKDYAYTKNADLATQSKIGNVLFSQGAKKSEAEKFASIRKPDSSESIVVPSELFSHLDLNKISDLQTLKVIVSNWAKLPLKDIKLYHEIKTIKEGKKRKYSVIVTPNDGDDAAWRKDVSIVFLTKH